jgi:hypothetical protein
MRARNLVPLEVIMNERIIALALGTALAAATACGTGRGAGHSELPDVTGLTSGSSATAAATSANATSASAVPTTRSTAAKSTTAKPTGKNVAGGASIPATGTGSAHRPSPATSPGSLSGGGGGHLPGRTSASAAATSAPSVPGNRGCSGPLPTRIGSQWTQTISFPEIGAFQYPAAHVHLAGCATSGLPLTYELADNNNCDLNGSELDVQSAPADCTVVARQAGNGQWRAAAPVSRSYSVSQQPIDGSWGPPNAGTHVALSAGKFTIRVNISSNSSFQAFVTLISRTEAVCASSDLVEIDGNGKGQADISISLNGPGQCTLGMDISGIAISAAGTAPDDRTYTIDG